MPPDPALAAFDHERKNGDREVAKQMARDWVQEHRTRIAPDLEKHGLETLVGLVGAYRKAGRDDDRIIVDMWLMSEYDPQRIVGTVAFGVTPETFDAITAHLQKQD